MLYFGDRIRYSTESHAKYFEQRKEERLNLLHITVKSIVKLYDKFNETSINLTLNYYVIFLEHFLPCDYRKPDAKEKKVTRIITLDQLTQR